MNRKYIFVSGGVVSSLGKGITAASLGKLLKSRGYKVSIQKCDPYYNTDPGLLSPLQHGETFVTHDGICADLDLGHYERILDCNLSGKASITTGKIHRTILEKELAGAYNGDTIQVIPHVTSEIINKIIEAADYEESEIAIIEIGGTIGDMESLAYFEAARQLKRILPKKSCCFIHVTLLPYISAAKEIKTKPTQHSVKVLRSLGIQPDIIVCRTESKISTSIKDKIALFCNIKPDHVIENIDADTLYDVPILLEKEKFAEKVCDVLSLEQKNSDLHEWENYVYNIKNPKNELNIAIVGKYVSLKDAYLSCMEALYHAGEKLLTKVKIDWIDSGNITEFNVKNILNKYNGILLPGGYGTKGTEGMITTCKYARENNIPFLSIGLGMQLSVAEAVRNLLGIKNANSLESNPKTANPIAKIPDERVTINDSRGAARCGLVKIISSDNLFDEIYQNNYSEERHCNRYEIINKYDSDLKKKQFIMCSKSYDGKYNEMYYYKENDFYVSCLFHPEFLSRPTKPHILFVKFLEASLNRKEK